MDEGTLRLARPDDADAIQALMRASIRDIFPSFYDELQTASAVIHVGHVDRQLIDDGTYFVIEEADATRPLVACGGWSRRGKLYTGSGDADDDVRLLDPTTEPARVRAIFVRGDRTRRGLGTRILEACEDAARREGFRDLVLGQPSRASRCTSGSDSWRRPRCTSHCPTGSRVRRPRCIGRSGIRFRPADRDPRGPVP